MVLRLITALPDSDRRRRGALGPGATWRSATVWPGMLFPGSPLGRIMRSTPHLGELALGRQRHRRPDGSGLVQPDRHLPVPACWDWRTCGTCSLVSPPTPTTACPNCCPPTGSRPPHPHPSPSGNSDAVTPHRECTPPDAYEHDTSRPLPRRGPRPEGLPEMWTACRPSPESSSDRPGLSRVEQPYRSLRRLGAARRRINGRLRTIRFALRPRGTWASCVSCRPNPPNSAYHTIRHAVPGIIWNSIRLFGGGATAIQMCLAGRPPCPRTSGGIRPKRTGRPDPSKGPPPGWISRRPVKALR